MPKSDTKSCEKFGFQGADSHKPAVRGLVKIIDAAAVQHTAFPHGHGAAREIARAVHGVKRNNTVLHGDIDKLSFTCAFAINDGRENTGNCVHGAAGHVRNLEVIETGAACLPSGRPCDAGPGQVVDVVACLHRKGAALSIACDRTVDQTGIDFAQLFIANTELIHNTGPELLDDNVIFHDQFFDRLHSRRFF